MKDYSGLIWTVIIVGTFVGVFAFAIASDHAETERLVETTNQTNSQLQNQVDDMNDMLFYKDETTGLCFASTGGYRSRTMASVDCTKLNNPITFWSK